MTSPALWLYRALVALVLPLAVPSLWLSDRRRARSRPPWSQRLGFGLPSVPANGIWIQAVSVGEVSVARALIAELRRRHPGCPIVLSATTSTGLRVASGEPQADAVVPFPVDLPGPVRRAFEAVSPRLVVLIETELWPEMLAACAKHGTPVVLVNARVSDGSLAGYRAVRAVLRPLLRPVTLALAQEQRDAERLAAIGIAPERVRVSGNIKFDVASPGAAPEIVGQLARRAGGRPVWVAGSTMPGEEESVLGALQRLPAEKRPFLVLAPRHPERAGDAMQLAAARGFVPIRRTLIGEETGRADVVVLDTIGELAALYDGAAIAFIGGSLVPTGGHNPIEPARFGVPVLTGPHVRNFSAIYHRFVDAGAARVVRDEAELGKAVLAWLSDPAAARRAGQAGRELLALNAGATARTVSELGRFLQ